MHAWSDATASRSNGRGEVGTFDTRSFALLNLDATIRLAMPHQVGVTADEWRTVRRSLAQWGDLDPPCPGVGAGDRSAPTHSALRHQSDRKPPQQDPQRQAAALMVTSADDAHITMRRHHAVSPAIDRVS